MKKNIKFKRFIYNESKLDMHSAAAALIDIYQNVKKATVEYSLRLILTVL